MLFKSVVPCLTAMALVANAHPVVEELGLGPAALNHASTSPVVSIGTSSQRAPPHTSVSSARHPVTSTFPGQPITSTFGGEPVTSTFGGEPVTSTFGGEPVTSTNAVTEPVDPTSWTTYISATGSVVTSVLYQTITVTDTVCPTGPVTSRSVTRPATTFSTTIAQVTTSVSHNHPVTSASGHPGTTVSTHAVTKPHSETTSSVAPPVVTSSAF